MGMWKRGVQGIWGPWNIAKCGGSDVGSEGQ